MRRTRLLPVLVVLGLAAVSQAQTFNLFAAASLKESATEIAHAFEKRYPNFKVSLNLAGSQQLAAQIRQGAPCDVLLSAGMEPLKTLTYEKSSLRIFAYNSLALIVPTGSTRVRNLKDLNRGASLIVADSHVPVGHYAEEMLSKAAKEYGADWNARVQRAIVSREQDVRAVLAKVSLREADAGIVYVTDADTAKGKVQVISIPDKLNVEADYPAVRFAGSPNADLAKDFMRFLFEKEAQKALVNHGFGSPIIPGGAIQLDLIGRPILLNTQAISRLPVRQFTASEHGVVKNFTGHDLGPLLSSGKGQSRSLKISAGDGYTQTVELDPALQNGIYLVDSPHGNYQLILPTMSPKFWVHWVREMIVQ